VEKIITDPNTDFSKGTYVLEFFARWCGTCRQVSKSFAALEPQYDAVFIKIDTEHEKSLTDLFNVKGIPSVIVLKDGIEVARKSESMNVEEFKESLDSVL